MPAPIFIGDEVSAAGYRLAGVRVHTPTDDEELRRLFDTALGEAELVLLDVAFARRLPADVVHAAERALRPRLLIVPDIRGRHPTRDLLHRLRAQLGVNV